MEVHFLAWKASGTRADSDLIAAHKLLEHLRDHAPEGCADTMVENVPLHREILAAWREQFGDDGDAPDEASPGESPTRAG